LSKHQIGKGAAYLYIEAITTIFSAYVFWFILTKITSPSVIGTSSTLISLTAILGTIATLGVPGGVQRFLGKTLHSDYYQEDPRSYVKTSILIIFLGIAACSTITIVFKNWIYNSFNFDLIILSVLLLGTSALSTMFRGMVISTLKTRIISMVAIFSTCVKLALAIILVLAGAGAFGIVLAYTSYLLLLAIFLGFRIRTTIFRGAKRVSNAPFRLYFKNIIVAGMATWVPGSIAGIGTQLGIIVVFGSQGASQAGFYFIAFSIVTGISTIMAVLSSIAYPALSAMDDGRKRLSWRMIKMNLIIGVPLSSAALFYSKEVMELFGREYGNGAASLDILLLSTLPTAILTGVTSLVFAYGNYRRVLSIGIATNVSRMVLYFILVPIFNGGTGAAISYTIGAILGFVVSVAISKNIGLHIFWRKVLFILCVPIALSYAFANLGINYIVGIAATLIVSYVLYTKFRILDEADIEDIGGVLPASIANPVNRVFNLLGRKSD
jgi:O-antigen/teichoic acid export membrane protein